MPEDDNILGVILEKIQSLRTIIEEQRESIRALQKQLEKAKGANRLAEAASEFARVAGPAQRVWISDIPGSISIREDRASCTQKDRGKSWHRQQAVWTAQARPATMAMTGELSLAGPAAGRVVHENGYPDH